MKRIITGAFCVSALLMSQHVVAQGSGSNSLNINSKTTGQQKKPVIKKPKPLSKEFSLGLRVNSDGWGLFVDRGRLRSEDRNPDMFHNVRIIQVELSERRHFKEIKAANSSSTTPGTSNPSAFIYGKVNSFYTFKLGYGNRKMIAGKPEQGTVSIHWVYLGGLSLGLLKPYYIDVSNGFETKSIKYSDSTSNQFINYNQIVGSSGWSKGLSETKIVPGFFLRTGFHFDFANNKRAKMALETGATLEYYTSEIQQMAMQKEQSMFFNVYAALQFGKRR